MSPFRTGMAALLASRVHSEGARLAGFAAKRKRRSASAYPDSPGPCNACNGWPTCAARASVAGMLIGRGIARYWRGDIPMNSWKSRLKCAWSKYWLSSAAVHLRSGSSITLPKVRRKRCRRNSLLGGKPNMRRHSRSSRCWLMPLFAARSATLLIFGSASAS